MLNKKICFYTAIFRGDHFKYFDKPCKFKKINGCDYKLFTNINKEVFNTSWDIVNIDFPDINNSIIKARKIKHQGYKILDDYDIIIWCDGYWYPKNDERIFKKIINIAENSDNGIIMSPNPYRKCAYEECDEIVRLKKESKEKIEKTKKFLKLNNLPNNFHSWRTTFICIDNSNKNKSILFDKLWDLLKNDEYTYRDQPLLSLAIFQTNITPFKCPILMQNAFNMGKIGKHTYI